MKIAIASDLHLEFGDYEIENTEQADVLILSGDIMIARDLHDHPEENISKSEQNSLGKRQESALRFRDFLKRVSLKFPNVVYVAGNHEFYRGKFIGSLQDLRNECFKFPNIHFMEDDCRKIDDVTFIGSTLWTDMNKGDPLTLHSVADMMNDFRLIVHDGLGYTRLRPAHVADRHRRSVAYIRAVTERKFEEKFVVVGHMAPSKISIHPKYKDDHIINGAYTSDLSEFILDHPQIKLWTHGHTHEDFDYQIGSTRIVCNPRGYIGYEPRADNYKLKYVEI
jgi:predicted phosphodiesterase